MYTPWKKGLHWLQPRLATATHIAAANEAATIPAWYRYRRPDKFIISRCMARGLANLSFLPPSSMSTTGPAQIAQAQTGPKHGRSGVNPYLAAYLAIIAMMNIQCKWRWSRREVDVTIGSPEKSGLQCNHIIRS